MVGAKLSAAENEVPVFEKRICVTGLSASVADSASVTVRLLVAAEPLLMAIVPAGGWLSTMILIAVSAKFPAASVARAARECVPLVAVVVFQVVLYGEVVSVAMMLLPSNRN